MFSICVFTFFSQFCHVQVTMLMYNRSRKTEYSNLILSIRILLEPGHVIVHMLSSGLDNVKLLSPWTLNYVTLVRILGHLKSAK